jgi:hypothetical protein
MVFDPLARVHYDGRVRMVLIPVRHHPGRHCASTGIRDLVNFHRISWSEAMCFGIGAGLGIWYLDLAGTSLSRLIHVRSADIEEQFFRRIGYPFSWEVYEDPAQSEHALCACLDRGLPAIIRTDIYYLPYYNSSTHFPGHVITVWGYDSTEEHFLVTDTEREDLIEVPFENMRRARYNTGGFFEIKGNMFSPETIAEPEDLSAVISRAIAFNSRVILNETHDFQGIAGLKKWQQEIMNWGDLADWQWTARFTYQVIERRGTGGGGFRLMYADFLREATDYVPSVASLGLAEQMVEVGRAWHDLAMALKGASEAKRPDFSDVAQRLRIVTRKESAYHADAVTLG